MLLGCIADDITGATDLGLMLASHGMTTAMHLGVPGADVGVTTQAVVIGLKIRTVEPGAAVHEALRAADWLLERDARQLFYKYCSTFDSTARGNIGPVSNALLIRLGETQTALCPAFPENGRVVVGGNLYVDGTLLAQSPMRHHPLTPMTESSLVKLMDAQTRAGETGLVPLDIVTQGSAAVRRALHELRSKGFRYAVADSETHEDLSVIAGACTDLKLLTGGSGVAAAIPETLSRLGLMVPREATVDLPRLDGNVAVLAGSCSTATRAQVRDFGQYARVIAVDPLKLHSGDCRHSDLARRTVKAAGQGNVIVTSAIPPEHLLNVQSALGTAQSAELVERTLAGIATELNEAGIRKFIVAGGETSGAVAKALAISELRIGPQIDPGVPWMVTTQAPPRCVAFKSGNFGRPDFFCRALRLLP